MSSKTIGIAVASVLAIGALMLVVVLRSLPRRADPASAITNRPQDVAALTNDPAANDVPLFATYPEDTIRQENRLPGVDALSFTYQPNNQPSPRWPDGGARLLIPRRLIGAPNVRTHVYIYLPTDNTTDTTPEQSYLPTLSAALDAVSAETDAVIMIPYHSHEGDDYTDFNLSEFYVTGIKALHSIVPDVTIIDTVVSGHGSPTCKAGPVITQALNGTIPNIRAVLVYDGCIAGEHESGDQALSPKNFTPSNGTSVYLGVNTSAMGSDLLKTPSGGELFRPAAVQALWNLTAQTCSPCAANAGIQQCYGTTARYERPGGGSLMSFTLGASHKAAIRTVTAFALCELYGS